MLSPPESHSSVFGLMFESLDLILIAKPPTELQRNGFTAALGTVSTLGKHALKLNSSSESGYGLFIYIISM